MLRAVEHGAAVERQGVAGATSGAGGATTRGARGGMRPCHRRNPGRARNPFDGTSGTVMGWPP